MNIKQLWLNLEIPEFILNDLNEGINFENKLDNKLSSSNANQNPLNETEIKIKCNEDIFDKYFNNNFQFKSTAYEENIMISDKNGLLYKADARIRLRKSKNILNDTCKAKLTIKKPKPQNNSVIKEEFEAEISITETEYNNLLQFLINKEYFIESSYERIRHTLHNIGLNLEAVIDILPDIGRYTEIEGDKTNILKALTMLNISEHNAITDPYDTIHSDYMLSIGEKEKNIISFINKNQTIKEEQKLIRRYLNESTNF